ncbi:MAG: SDR family oxidoreductase [Actinomycetia bacterium]|nr:SDR family oxidoreductase [Actinomycetes bacterium]
MNNAAIHRTIPILEVDVDIWRKIIDINLTGSFLCAREAALIMKRQNGGKIINVSSAAAKLFFPGFGAYSASKAGMVGFSNVLAEELKPYNINVIAVNLGLVNTEYSRSRIKDDEPQDWLQPDEVAEVIMFLCSSQANIITGTAIDVFGRRK